MKTQNLMNGKYMGEKDIIDVDKEKIGTVSSLQVDVIDKIVVGVLVKEISLSAELGLGESRIIPIENVQA